MFAVETAPLKILDWATAYGFPFYLDALAEIEWPRSSSGRLK